MTVPLLFLFPTSCNKQSNAIGDQESGELEMRTTEFCENHGCGNPIITNVVGEVYVINGCSIYVNYILEICLHTSISIRNMSYTFANTQACNNYQQIWNQYFLNGQSQLANESINQLYKLLSQMIEDKILNSYPNIATLHFIETFCHTLCAKKINDDGENPPFFQLSQQVCGKSCCIRSTKVVNGVKTTSVVYEGGGCDPIPVNCAGDIHISTICDPACARL